MNGEKSRSLVFGFLWSCLFCQVHSSVFSETKLSEEEINNEVNSLYTSMSKKSSPLYICDPDVGGIEWLPPQRVNCELQPKRLDIAKPVSLTVYWTDISLQVIDGYECSGTKVYAEGNRNYFSSEWTITETTLVLRIPAQQCQDMIKDRVSPLGKELLRVNDDLFETGFIQNRTYITYFFARGYNETRVNYRIQKVKLSVSSIDNTIQSTALLVEPCLGNASFCPTTTGILAWEGSNVKSCRLKEGDDSNCLMRISDNMTVLTCPDLKLSLHNVETVSMCGVQFGHSQGIYFLLHAIDKSFPNMATPEGVKNIITHPRHKREIGNATFHPFEAAIKANFNFLYETIKTGTIEAVWKFEQKVCEASKAQLDLVNALTQSGHPGLITRLLYNNDLSYRADLSGDVPTVYRCIEIFEYMFTERKTCIFEWPIKYIYNHKEFEGYMTAGTHTIVPAPTYRSKRIESCSRFYFKTDKFVVLLSNNKATEVNLPTLPQKNAVHEEEQFLPPLSFVPSGKLDSNSADVGAFHQMFKEVQQKGLTPNITENYVQFVDETNVSIFGDIFGVFGNWFSSLWNGIIGFLWSIIAPLACIILGIILIVIVVRSGFLPYIGNLPRNMWSSFKRGYLRKPIKKIKKALGLRKQAKLPSRQTTDTYAPSAPILYLGNGAQTWSNSNDTYDQPYHTAYYQAPSTQNVSNGSDNRNLYPRI